MFDGRESLFAEKLGQKYDKQKAPRGIKNAYIASGKNVLEPKKAWGIAVKNVFDKYGVSQCNENNTWNTHIGLSLLSDKRTNDLSVDNQAELAYKSGLLKTNNDSYQSNDVFNNYTAYKDKWFSDRNKHVSESLSENNIFGHDYALSPKSNFEQDESIFEKTYDYIDDKVDGVINEVERNIEKAKYAQVTNLTGKTIRGKKENTENEYIDLPHGVKSNIPLDGVIVDDKIIKINDGVDVIVGMDDKTGQYYADYDSYLVDLPADIVGNTVKSLFNIAIDIGVLDKDKKELSGIYDYDEFTVNLEHSDWIDPQRKNIKDVKK